MSVENETDLKGLRRAGQVVAHTLRKAAGMICAGIATSDLDDAAAETFTRAGARSAPALVYGFPRTILISVNDEIVHGVPGSKRLAPGDLVSVDVTVELDGYIADGADTFLVPPETGVNQELVDCARSACHRGLSEARAGRRVSAIGRAVETEVLANGFSVVPELVGHGTGRTIHEDPIVCNYYDPHDRQLLTEGLVITIEPMVTTGSGRTRQDRDNWTIRTADGHPAAHFEHTIVVTHDSPIILTAAG